MQPPSPQFTRRHGLSVEEERGVGRAADPGSGVLNPAGVTVWQGLRRGKACATPQYRRPNHNIVGWGLKTHSLSRVLLCETEGVGEH